MSTWCCQNYFVRQNCNSSSYTRVTSGESYGLETLCICSWLQSSEYSANLASPCESQNWSWRPSFWEAQQNLYLLIKFDYFWVVGPKTEPASKPFETPAPTSPLRPIKPEEHYLRRQLSQSLRAQRRITEDLSLLMAEGDKYWWQVKCCSTIIVTILIAVLLLVIIRWVLYK